MPGYGETGIGAERDLDVSPYSKDELRVVTYLRQIAPDIGAGDDPIGFLMASHNALIGERRSRQT